jgi:hypothetical protein
MSPADKPAFATALIEVGELYSRKLSTVMIEIYWLALKNHPIEAVTSAFAAHLTDPEKGAFMPKPADLILHLAGGPPKDQAALAWAKVERAIRLVGAYQTVVFDDPIIMMALGDMGSWPALCHTREEDMPFKDKEFRDLYAAYLKRPKGEYPRSLPGLLDQTNAPQGFRLSPPVLLEDVQKALTVWHGGKDIATLAPPVRATAGLLASSQPAAPRPPFPSLPPVLPDTLPARRALPPAVPEATEQDCRRATAGSRSPPKRESALAFEETLA